MMTLDTKFRKPLTVLLGIAIAIFVSSCGDDENDLDTANDFAVESSDLDVESEAGVETILEDLDNLTEAGMDAINIGGRTLRDELLDCATVTHDEENQTITIDYGDGCEGPGGRVRSGILVITYTDQRLVPGAVRTIVPENFFVDSVQVEGTRIVTNISESEESVPVFRVELIGGRLTFTDETTFTREAVHTRTWIRGANPRLDESNVEGEANGTDRDGNDYRVQILEPIVYQRSCGFLPVSGVKEIIINGGESVITYEGTETIHQLVVGRELTGKNAF